MLHVLSNLTRLPGLRKRVLTLLADDSIPSARSEIRSCGWMAQVDENGGSIFHYRPLSKGAQDMAALVEEVRELFNNGPQAHTEAASPEVPTITSPWMPPPCNSMTKLPEGKSRLDLVKSGLTGGLPKRGRFIVSIDRLQEDPDNERKIFNNMDDMIESVRRHGIIEPITVTQDGERYRILTGHRRFRAAKAVGLTELEVLVREADDQITRRFKSLISNIQRENIAAVELAETLRSLLDSGAVATQRELAAQIGKSEQWMSGMLRFWNCPHVSKRSCVNTPGIGYEMAQRIAQVDDSRLQEELVAAAVAGESTPQHSCSD
jgi:ParB/RepB/Spo0J family partition protein